MELGDRLLFAEYKPAVVDAAVCRNPAKWKERNERRRQSRKNSRKPQGGRGDAQGSGPTWEVQQNFPADGGNDDEHDMIKKPEKIKSDHDAKPEKTDLQNLSLKEIKDRLAALGVKETPGVVDRQGLEELLAKALEKKQQRDLQETARQRQSSQPQRAPQQYEPPPPEQEEQPRQGPRKPKGQTMPGGYFVRSYEEMHEQTMRAFNVRLTKPFRRSPRVEEDDEEIPPLEPEEPEEQEAAESSDVRSKAAQEAERRMKAKAEAEQLEKKREEEKKRRADEEAAKRKQAEEREKRRLVQAKITKLQEEEDAKEKVRRELEEKNRQVEEAKAEARRRRKAEADGQSEEKVRQLAEEQRQAEERARRERELRRQRRLEKDAEEDARIKEERRVMKEKEEAARKEAKKRREAERRRKEQERKEREEAELLARLQAEEDAAKRRRQEEAARRAAEDAKKGATAASETTKSEVAATEKPKKQVRIEEPEKDSPELSEEELRQKEAEKEEKRRQAEQRRREAKEKAERAKRAAAGGGAASSASAQEAGEKPGMQPPTVHVNVALLGHQGSGKSTLVGAILLATGALSERDLAKRRKEAERTGSEELQREEGARTRGGAQLTLLDVPGGRKSLPQAVQASAEADVALLVVSAKGRELESAMKEASGGSSVLQEQLRVASGLGARRLVVAVSKMDEASWAQDRFQGVISALKPLLESTGFQQASVSFVPVDGLSAHLDGKKASWHSSGSLLECLDEAAGSFVEMRQGPARVLIFESIKDTAKGGVLRIRGRVEQGKLLRGQRCLLAPGQLPCVVEAVQMAGAGKAGPSRAEAKSGEAVELQLSGGPFPDLPNYGGATTQTWCGAVLADAEASVRAVDKIKASMDVLEMPRPLTVGFKCVLHVHAATVEAEVEKIQDATDLATGVVTEKPKMVKAGQRLTLMLKLSREVPVCEAPAQSSCGRLSLLMLREGETTIAIGHVLDVPKDK